LTCPGRAEVRAPGGLDVSDHREANVYELASSGGDGDESGSPVMGVGGAMDVPGALEMVDDGANCLLRHLGGLGKVCQPGSVGCDALEHPCLMQRKVVPVGSEGVQNGGLHEAVGDEQQKPEIRLRVDGFDHPSCLHKARRSD